MEDKCKNCENCEKGASGCDTGEPCVLAFLKALQERYFYHGFNKRNKRLRSGDVLTAWEHRLGTLNKPAEDLIATIKTDALTMIVQHSKKDTDTCPIRWLCGSIAPCNYATSKVNDKEELLTNRRLVLLEYPFLINFAAAKRIAGWKFDADEIFDFYKTFSIKKEHPIDIDGNLKRSFCGFLEMLCNTEAEDQKRIVLAIERCIQRIMEKKLKASQARKPKSRKLKSRKPKSRELTDEDNAKKRQDTIKKFSRSLIDYFFVKKED